MSAADHLQVPRQHGLFNHHGIDLGDGTVAHYLEGREILRSCINDFCGGQRYTLIIHEHPSPKELTLERATSRIGEQRYNLLFNNCEHFANWCKTGRHQSDQVDNWTSKANIGFNSVKKLIQEPLFEKLNYLLKQNLSDQSSQEKARELINNFKKIKEILLQKLELTLEEIEYWHSFSLQKRARKNKQSNQTLLLKGQRIADQIHSLESVEAQISNLLSKKDPKK